MTRQTKSELDNLFDDLKEYCEDDDRKAMNLLSHIRDFFADKADGDPDGMNFEARIAGSISFMFNKPNPF